MNIRQISDVERHLQEQVQALESAQDELLHENNLIRARNERLTAENGLWIGQVAIFRDLVEETTKQIEIERNTAHAMSEQLESVRAAGKLASDALKAELSTTASLVTYGRVERAIEALKAGGAA